MNKKAILPIIAGTMLVVSSSQVSAQMSDEAFAQMKGLSGEWAGTLNLTPGEHLERLGVNAEQALKLTYSVRSGGSSILEESTSDGVEMVTIYNTQGGNLLNTHYCVLMNKPVGTLDSSTDGVLSFTTDVARSGLEEGKDEYVSSWRLNLEPENPNQFTYEYTVIKPDMTKWMAKAVISRVN